MPKAVMQGDGSKPAQFLPWAFRPGGGVVEGHIEMDRDNVRWQVLGFELESGRLWCKGSEVTAWIGPSVNGSRTS